MGKRLHHYSVDLEWTGDCGTGTSSYTAYSRDHELAAHGKPVIPGSSDPAFRGDPARWNPEELLLAAASACHQLWYLHLAAEAGIVVTGYRDQAEAVMTEEPDGSGRFTQIVLKPTVIIARGGDPLRAAALHADVHDKCAIANSLNCPVECRPTIKEADP